jgi:tRNA(Ile)-lysidine synthase
MQDSFDRILKEMLPERGAVLLAVSGGVDSMCMADLFLNSSLCPDFAIAHCNFHLRGEESDADEALVKDWAESHGRIFLGKDFDTLGYSAEKGVSVEMAARELRYAWFAEMCRKRNFSVLAVAHNANDNAETMILNMLRGTGVKGMTGMRPCSYLPGSTAVMIRPLLGFPRKDIHEYAVLHNLRWREDRTNADSTFKRNCIRNEIFPLFKRLNPSFLTTLNEDMERFAQVQAIADDFLEEVESDAVTRSADGLPEIDFRRLLSRKNWEYALFRLLEPYGFTASVACNVVDLLKKDGTVSGKRFLSNEYVAVTGSHSLHVRRRNLSDGPDQGDSVMVTGPGEYSLNGVGFIVAASDDVSVVKTGPGETRFDASVIPFPFEVRRWRPGDWMRPLGLNGRKKLSDLFVDLKMSAADKEKALVIADEGSHVLSLVGHRIDDSVKVTLRSVSVTSVKII